MAADCSPVVAAVLLSLLRLCSCGVGRNSQVYEENLFMRDIPGGKVLAFFMFKTTWHITPEEIHKDAAGSHCKYSGRWCGVVHCSLRVCMSDIWQSPL